jgi:esterase/lipase
MSIDTVRQKTLTLLFFALSTASWAGDIAVFRTEHVPVNGVVIAAHGLNVAPSKMGAPQSEGTIVKALLDGGYHVVRAALTGHTGSVESMKSVTEEAWLDDARACILAARAEAVKAAGQNRCPVYLAGFSLGALVFEVLMNEASSACFDKAVLFSPAVAVKDLARGILALEGASEGGGRIIASRSPAEYRAQAGASIAAYKALFSLEKRLAATSFAKSNIPTLGFIDPKDELVSCGKLEKLIKKFSLTNWRLQKVAKSGASIRPAYHHLIIDDNCLGKESWDAVRRAMLDFFNG